MKTRRRCEEPNIFQTVARAGLAVGPHAWQEQVKVAEDWHRGILHAASDGMLIVNEHGTIALANAELARMFGYAQDELNGQPMEMLVPEHVKQVHARMRMAMGKSMREGQVRALSGDLCARHKDGSEFTVEVTLSRLPQAVSHLGTICAAVRDTSERKRMEAAVAASEAQCRDNSRLVKAVLESYPDVSFFALDKDYRYLAFNEKHREAMRTRWGRDIAPGTNVLDLFGEHSDREKARCRFDRARAGDSFVTEESCGGEAPARRFWQSHWSPMRDEAGHIHGLTCLSLDITGRKRVEERLARREREFRTLVEHTPDMVIRYGRDLGCLYANPAVAVLAEGGVSAVIGKQLYEYADGPNADYLARELAAVLRSGKEREFELAWTGANGQQFCSLVRLTPEFDNDGAVESILAIGRDISELIASRQKIQQMAFYDSLTSLPNRALFNDRLRQAISDAAGHGLRAGVMLIDMDRFKTVNDTMGHAVGDELLCETAMRLIRCVRTDDTVARLGGDEFAILLPEIVHDDELRGIADKILRQFDYAFLLDGREVFVSCSIGIAVCPDDSTDAHDLMKYADSAMYFAKRSGRNNFRFYSRNLTDSASERLMLESELRHAIERGQLELHYQPKVLLESGVMIGSEALLRWRHPQLGMVPPNQFIQVAEDTGLIVDVGKWVLRHACRAAAEWNAVGKGPHKVAVNLSVRQFHAGDLAGTVAVILQETDCRPEWIELEITESFLLDEDGKTLESLASLRAMGITIAIDDFGTGYSALSYLARFPINTLKIDRSFIHSVTIDKCRAELVKAILSIAHCLGQQAVAEGVETIEQARFLQSHGCQVAQGYLYSKPLPKTGMDSLMRQRYLIPASGVNEGTAESNPSGSWIDTPE